MGTGLESCQVCKTFSTPIYKQFYCKSSTRTGYFRKQDNMVSGVMRERYTGRERDGGGGGNGQKRDKINTNKKHNIYHVIINPISNL